MSKPFFSNHKTKEMTSITLGEILGIVIVSVFFTALAFVIYRRTPVQHHMLLSNEELAAVLDIRKKKSAIEKAAKRGEELRKAKEKVILEEAERERRSLLIESQEISEKLKTRD